MFTTHALPGWLTEPCPGWCDQRHDDQELLADRRHHSVYWVVPVIQPQARHPYRSPSRDRVEASELNLLAFRDVGDRETWVTIANDQQRLELTLESALRLRTDLQQLLDTVTTNRS